MFWGAVVKAYVEDMLKEYIVIQTGEESDSIAEG